MPAARSHRTVCAGSKRMPHTGPNRWRPVHIHVPYWMAPTHKLAIDRDIPVAFNRRVATG